MRESIFWLLVIAYGAHVMEEYILNWKKWVLTVANIDISWNEFIITNAVVIISSICFAMIGFNNPYISLMLPALMIINAIFFHILPTIIKRQFSPGVLTSIILFLPLSLLAYYEAYKLNFLNTELLVTTICGGSIIMAYPIFLHKIKGIISE